MAKRLATAILLVLIGLAFVPTRARAASNYMYYEDDSYAQSFSSADFEITRLEYYEEPKIPLPLQHDNMV